MREEIAALERQLSTSQKEIEQLKKECRRWEMLATEWMNGFDRLKEKYEPLVLVCSDPKEREAKE